MLSNFHWPLNHPISKTHIHTRTSCVLWLSGIKESTFSTSSLNSQSLWWFAWKVNNPITYCILEIKEIIGWHDFSPWPAIGEHGHSQLCPFYMLFYLDCNMTGILSHFGSSGKMWAHCLHASPYILTQAWNMSTQQIL